MRISDWSSDVCSSDLQRSAFDTIHPVPQAGYALQRCRHLSGGDSTAQATPAPARLPCEFPLPEHPGQRQAASPQPPRPSRSEEHTSELQSLMRISYAVFCLKKKPTQNQITHTI